MITLVPRALNRPWRREISMRPPAKPRGKQYNAVLMVFVHRISINFIDLMNAPCTYIQFPPHSNFTVLKRGWNSTTSTTMFVRRCLNREQRKYKILVIFPLIHRCLCQCRLTAKIQPAKKVKWHMESSLKYFQIYGEPAGPLPHANTLFKSIKI